MVCGHMPCTNTTRAVEMDYIIFISTVRSTTTMSTISSWGLCRGRRIPAGTGWLVISLPPSIDAVNCFKQQRFLERILGVIAQHIFAFFVGLTTRFYDMHCRGRGSHRRSKWSFISCSDATQTVLTTKAKEKEKLHHSCGGLGKRAVVSEASKLLPPNKTLPQKAFMLMISGGVMSLSRDLGCLSLDLDRSSSSSTSPCCPAIYRGQFDYEDPGVISR